MSNADKNVKLSNAYEVRKEKQAIYRELHKDKLMKYMAEYREKNAEKLNEYYINKAKEYKSELIHCDICNIDTRRDTLARHNKTEKHEYNKQLKIHNIEPQENKHYCFLCSKFITITHYVEHTKTAKHIKNENIKCELEYQRDIQINPFCIYPMATCMD